ncbi:phosphonate C-P lyase system protein PhnL [Patescibacteria group bacterium]|nr:phosphonate C-P lyase system protein PhnL [Patescibacteria group bacterium]
MVLEIKDLRKTFTMHAIGKQLTALNGVSFSANEGEFIGIMGKSGSGKSTLLKCIYRTCLPTAGSIIYHNIDLTKAKDNEIIALRRKEIGYVSQFLRVIPRVTTVDVVAEPLIWKGYTREKARDEASYLLRKLEIKEELLNAYPTTFSGGEKQRVNLARAIISRPSLLLLDEPTSALDAESSKKVVEMMLKLKQEGTTILGTFHNTEILKKTSDRIFFMKNGCIEKTGKTHEILEMI